MPPRHIHTLIPGTCEWYLIWQKKKSADVIKLTILDEQLSSIIWLGPKCNQKYPYKKEAEGDLTHTEEKGTM